MNFFNIFFESLMCGLLLVSFLLFILKQYVSFKKTKRARLNKNLCVGFFHPYCNAGGGGERVLWAAVRAVQKKYKDADCIIYSGDEVADKDILKNVKTRFNIELSERIKIVHLKSRSFVEASFYPYFTLLLQSLGSVVLGFEALIKFVPDIYIDTMGYAFTFPIFKYLGSCKIVAYVHFPVISTDMLRVIQSRSVSVNNRRFISDSPFLSHVKMIYYKLFAYSYGIVGRKSDIVMVNSSWTKGHILELWNKPDCTFTVYPPCDVSEFENIPLERCSNENIMKIISIAQFRPEKNHQLQVKSLKELLNRLDQAPLVRLVMIGSCRNEDDLKRVQSLRDMIDQLNLSENVELKVNLTFQDIIFEMTNSSVALHTMKDEHFGISVVECMSAGLVMVAHNSGGPKLDIIDDGKTGFLATDVQTFADALEKIFKMKHKDLYEIRKNARESVSKFSDQNFEDAFLSSMNVVLV